MPIARPATWPASSFMHSISADDAPLGCGHGRLQDGLHVDPRGARKNTEPPAAGEENVDTPGEQARVMRPLEKKCFAKSLGRNTHWPLNSWSCKPQWTLALEAIDLDDELRGASGIGLRAAMEAPERRKLSRPGNDGDIRERGLRNQKASGMLAQILPYARTVDGRRQPHARVLIEQRQRCRGGGLAQDLCRLVESIEFDNASRASQLPAITPSGKRMTRMRGRGTRYP